MTLMKRCLAQLSLSGSWGTEHLWPGLEVNFARELAPGFTVADAIAGREDCFEDVVEAPIAMNVAEDERAGPIAAWRMSHATQSPIDVTSTVSGPDKN